MLHYFGENAEGLPRSKPSNAFWELPCPGRGAIVNWLFSPQITRVPFDAYGCLLRRAECHLAVWGPG